MYIFNSLTNKKEEFKTIEKNKVKMYVCGPTVYNFIHIGNARPVIFFDVVKRYLEYKGYEVTYVSNITDVDDKIINEAIKNNVSEQEISTKYTKAFLEDIERLNVQQYDINPKVTNYMSKIIEFIVELEKKGFAYEVNGDVYFAVNKIESYGQLSNQETEYLEIGARITEHSKKENPLDFTLWKKTNIGIQWDSPWGKGRPGWHTECVAMIHDTLGGLIDIHGGGSDLKFPHHENEIAQSCAICNSTLANYWMHNGRLMINDEKMSKSLGNFIMLKDFLNNYDYRILRLLMLSTHYRQPLNYTIENIEFIKGEIEKINSSLKQIQYKLDLNNYLDVDIKYESNDFCANIIKEFNSYMDDDFNTANVITVITKLMKEVNRVVRIANYSDHDLLHMLSLYKVYKVILDIFGINFIIERLDLETKEMIKKRDTARNAKDYATADKLRRDLQEKGINI
jgi:cysteinyl-tRNA synthetase